MTIQDYKKRFIFTEEDAKNLVQVGKIIGDERDRVYGQLLVWLQEDERVKKYVNESILEKVSKSRDGLWVAVCQAKLDEEYLEMQHQKTYAYSSMGVPFEIYYEATVFLFNTIEDLMLENGIDQIHYYRSFRKVAQITEAVLAEGYYEMQNNALREQSDALMSLSTPVSQIWDGILLLPLVGFIDSKRAQDIMSSMLEMIETSQAKVFILDISGINIVDTAVANHLIKMTKATQLMGCTCMISGIGSGVAQTIVELGIAIDEINTTGSLQDALRNSLNMVGEEA